MAKELWHIEGLSELQEALSELSKTTSKNVLKRALTKAAEPIRDQANSAAPRLSGFLAASITIGTTLSRRQKSQHTKESPVEVFVGPGPSAKSITQEFGAAHHRAQPYMRPAWDSNKRSALDTIAQDIKAEIDKAVERAERKAARIAAKIK